MIRLLALIYIIPSLGLAQEPVPIKIGYMPSLSGGHANDSVAEIKMVKLAEKKVNAAGGILGKPIEVVMIDNQSTPQGMLEAFNQLVEREKVSAILTNSKSVQIVSIAVAAKQAKVAVAIGGTNPKLTDDPENMFLRIRPDDEVMAEGLMQFIKENTPHRKVGMFFDSAENGASMANREEKYAKDLGELKVVARVPFKINASSLKEQFDAMVTGGADIVIANVTTGPDAALAYQTAKKYDGKFKMIATPSGARLPALKSAGSSANGYWVVSEHTVGSPEAKKVSADFKAEYKEELDPFTLWIYDGFNVLVEGIKLANGDPKAVKSAILDKRHFYGAMRTLNFDSRGDGSRSIDIAKIEKGSLVPFKTIDVKK